MKKIVWSVLIVTLSLWAENGMSGYQSHYGVEDTTKRLVAILRQKGMKVFKVVDHAEGAASVGAKMRPMKLVIFGNPKIGSSLIKCSPTIGLDLPQKMLVYEDNESITNIVYNTPRYLFWRHGIDTNCSWDLQRKMDVVLRKFAKYAAGVNQ